MLRGFIPLAGHANAGVDVYIQGLEEWDKDPPRYAFTIVDPLIRWGGERWMLVRQSNGTHGHVSRDAVVFSELYYVKVGDVGN